MSSGSPARSTSESRAEVLNLYYRFDNLYYRFDPSAWGQGYASEAAAAVVARLADEWPDLPVVARVATNNPVSVRVAERIGLVLQDAQHVLHASAPLRCQPVDEYS